MVELPLVFMGGLLGSSHCIGMCGPLALAVGASDGRLATNLWRQLAFSAGRLVTYGFGGALAAFAGWWLAQRPVAVVNVQAALAIVAGVVLIALGLSTAGLLPRLGLGWLAPHPCTSGSWLKTFLTAPGMTGVFLAGVFTGFIPCGLVYAFLAYAASAGSVLAGWLTMVVFGLGTVPLMVLAGCGGTLLSLTTRARVLQIAAWCIVVTGMISVARGAGYLQLAAGTTPGGCPLCP